MGKKNSKTEYDYPSGVIPSPSVGHYPAAVPSLGLFVDRVVRFCPVIGEAGGGHYVVTWTRKEM
jgi:hypothetical protein